VEFSTILSEQELLALLCLPFFQKPNELSPFYQFQMEQVGQDHDPTEGLMELYHKGLWEAHEEELTREGQTLFIPVFSPNSRIMVFKGAHQLTPEQEFYSYKQYTVRYSEKPGPTFRGPVAEQTLVNFLRTLLPDRRVPVSENKLSFFAYEYVLLLTIAELTREKNVSAEGIHQHIRSTIAENGALALPIIGLLPEDDPAVSSLNLDVIREVTNALAGDGLLVEAGAGKYDLSQSSKNYFLRILDEREVFMIREEYDMNQLLVREASLIEGEQGYICGRVLFDNAHGKRVVHLEDLEWFKLYTIINEMARPWNYAQMLTLEIVKRTHARVRG